MNTCPRFHVKKRSLLLLPGVVWLIAGINVSRMGLRAYGIMGGLSWRHIGLSLLVFAAFGTMFYKMSIKHYRRIRSYQQATLPFWHFFDRKSYLIMAFMMGGGIGLRLSGLVPPSFIAVFYTGVGFGLALAGPFFWNMYFRKNSQ